MKVTEEVTPSSNLSSSKLGVASMVLGILGVILYVLPFTVGYIAGYVAGLTGTGHPPDPMGPQNIAGMVISWCGNFLAFAALILGAISVAREKKKVFGIIGLALGIFMTCGCLATVAYNISQM